MQGKINDRRARKKHAPPCDCPCLCGAVNGFPAAVGKTRCDRCDRQCVSDQGEEATCVMDRECDCSCGDCLRSQERLPEPGAYHPAPPVLRHECFGCDETDEFVGYIYGAFWHSHCYRSAGHALRAAARADELRKIVKK